MTRYRFIYNDRYRVFCQSKLFILSLYKINGIQHSKIENLCFRLSPYLPLLLYITDTAETARTANFSAFGLYKRKKLL